MSALGTTQERLQEPLSTAVLNGRPVAVKQAHRVRGHRVGGAGAVLVTVTAPVALSLDDVAAVLLECLSNMAVDELGDDDMVWELIADWVVNGGCLTLEEAACDAEKAATDAHLLAYCRARATAVFAPGPHPTTVAQCGGVAR